jgi:hypothetical protein
MECYARSEYLSQFFHYRENFFPLYLNPNPSAMQGKSSRVLLVSSIICGDSSISCFIRFRDLYNMGKQETKHVFKNKKKVVSKMEKKIILLILLIVLLFVMLA